MLESPGRPGSPISGERSDIEVSRAAAQGLWSCSQSKKNKMVSVCVWDQWLLHRVMCV